MSSLLTCGRPILRPFALAFSIPDRTRERIIWKAIGIVFAVIMIVQLLLLVLGIAAFDNYQVNTDSYVEEYAEEIVN